jgi:hypothetical protein
LADMLAFWKHVRSSSQLSIGLHGPVTCSF